MDILDSKWNCAVCIDSRQGGRDENQDCYACADTPLGFVAVVCDGMGGGPGGANASTLAVQAIVQHLNGCAPEADAGAALCNAVQAANSLLRQTVSEHLELAGMGTTCVVALVRGRVALVAHVGDSRLYHVRGGRLVFRTADHSVVGEMVRRGELTEEDARRAANSNVITRALGVADNVSPDIDRLALAPADRLALCTDGVWGALPEQQIVAMIGADRSLDGAVLQVMNSVEVVGSAKPGYDNLTLGVVRIDGVQAAPAAGQGRARGKAAGGSRRVWLYVLGVMLAASVALNVYMAVGGRRGSAAAPNRDMGWKPGGTAGCKLPDGGRTARGGSAEDRDVEYQYMKRVSEDRHDTIRRLQQRLKEAEAGGGAPHAQPSQKALLIDRLVGNLNSLKEPQQRGGAQRSSAECRDKIMRDFKSLQNEHRRSGKALENIGSSLQSREFGDISRDGRPSPHSAQMITDMVKQLNQMR